MAYIVLYHQISSYIIIYHHISSHILSSTVATLLDCMPHHAVMHACCSNLKPQPSTLKTQTSPLETRNLEPRALIRKSCRSRTWRQTLTPQPLHQYTTPYPRLQLGHVRHFGTPVCNVRNVNILKYHNLAIILYSAGMNHRHASMHDWTLNICGVYGSEEEKRRGRGKTEDGRTEHGTRNTEETYI